MLSIVIPFYNDAGCPKIFVRELKKELRGIEYEIILVDDCSKDSTPQELDSLKSQNIVIIHNKHNLDYGGAIIAGLDIAKGDIIGFTCGDGEVTAKDVIKVYKNMGNLDVIKAIRKNRQDGLDRKFISFIFNIWDKLRFGINLEDINGYPLFMKKEVYQKVYNLRKDWIFNTDLIRKILAQGYLITGVKVKHKKRVKGKSHMTPSRIIKMIAKFITYK